MTKYQKYFQDMLENNKEAFSDFQTIHDKYAADPERYQDEFNKKGALIIETIRKYENLLCSHSEGSKYGKFSSKLSDKFWATVRGKFPKIDFVGLQ